MNHIFSKYIMAGGATLLAKFMAAFGALAEIYFLNTLLGKQDYGAFMYAFTLVMIVGIAIGNPIKSLVLYRLSSNQAPVFTSPFFRSCFGIAIVLGIASIILIMTVGWHYWIISLASLAALEMIRVTLCSGLQAMQNIPTMSLYNTVFPYGLRFIVLVILALLSINDPTSIIIGYTLAFALPVIGMAVRYRVKPSLSFMPFVRADLSYGIKMILTQLVHQNARYIDIIFIGSIGIMGAAADYIVALKFATLLLLGKQLTQGLITPRLTDQNNHQEFAAARCFEMCVAMMGMVGFAATGWFILPFFGDYASVEPLFFLCAASMIPRVMTGSSAEFLSMKGYAGWVFIASALTLIVTIIAAFVFVPQYGAIGSAITAMVGASVANAVLWVGAAVEEKFYVTDMQNTMIGFALFLTCLTIGFQIIPIPLGAAILSFIFMTYIILHRHYIQFIKEYISHGIQ